MSVQRQIWKYELPGTDQLVLMPEKAKILSVQVQGSSLYLWALVNTKAPKYARRFRVFMTGEDLPYVLVLDHIGTVHNNGVTAHVFEVTP